MVSVVGLPPVEQEAHWKAFYEPNKARLIGPLLMGIFVDAVCLGILAVQVTHWVKFSPSERRFTRIVVTFCVLITTATTCYNVVYGMHDLVYGFGNYTNVNSAYYIGGYRLFDCFTAAGTQIFFVDRAAKLSGWPKTTWGFFLPLIIGACGSSITNFVIYRRNNKTGDYTTTPAGPSLIAWIVATVVIDSLLSIIIVYNLVQSRTGWANTDATIKRLIRMSLEASIPATVLAITLLIIFETQGDTRHSRINVFFDVSIAKFYVVCLLSLLNAKINLKRDMEASVDQDDSFFGEQGHKIRPAAVMVSTEVYTESHQMQKLPQLNAPRRAPIARLDEESSIDGEVINIDLGSSRSPTTPHDYSNKETTVKFQDMVKT